MGKKHRKTGIAVKTILAILIILVLLIVAFIVYKMQNDKVSKEALVDIFEYIENEEADLTEYIIYGTHLNIKGNINDTITNVQDVNLILASTSGEERLIDLKYEEEKDGISFYTSDLINKGIDLETIPVRTTFYDDRS